MRIALERDLVCDRHVVAEQHDVEAEPQRFERLRGRVIAGSRNQREIGRRHRRQAHLQTARRLLSYAVGRTCGGLLVERPLGIVNSGGKRCFVITLKRD